MNTLKPVFESDDIVKVGHNMGKFISTNRHQYSIDMKNIYDTQVGQMMVHEVQNFQSNPQSLIQCLHRFYPALVESADLYSVLGIDPTEFSWSMTKNGINTRQDMWQSRPLPPMLLAQATHASIHLLRLSKRQREKLIDPHGDTVRARSKEAVSILSNLNLEQIVNDEASLRIKPGDSLQGLVIEKSRSRITFDLNLPFIGVAEGLSMEGAWGFEDCEIGDVVELEMRPLANDNSIHSGMGTVGEIAQSGSVPVQMLPIGKGKKKIVEFPKEICVARRGFKSLHYDRKRNLMLEIGEMDMNDMLEQAGNDDPFYKNLRSHSNSTYGDSQLLNENDILRGNRTFHQENDRKISKQMNRKIPNANSNNGLKDFNQSLHVVTRGTERWHSRSDRNQHIKLHNDPPPANSEPKKFLGQKIYLSGKGGRYKLRTKMPEPKDDSGKNYL